MNGVVRMFAVVRTHMSVHQLAAFPQIDAYRTVINTTERQSAS